MKTTLRTFWKLLKRSFKQWNDKDPFRESAVIAYYAIFSLPGILLVVITLAGYFFGQEHISEYLYGQIAGAIGENTANQVQKVVDAAYDADQSFIATIIGIGTILFGATGVFFQLQKSLNFIWDVKPDPKRSGILQMAIARLFSLGMIISIAFLLLVLLVITAILSALSGYIESNLPDYFMTVFQILNIFISFAIITFLFALMFKYVPDAKIKWKTVWFGSALTSLLFILGKEGLGLYFRHASPGSGYGAAGFIILILLWTSYSSMIVFFGAEFTRAYYDYKYGGKIEPTRFATVDNKAELITKQNENDTPAGSSYENSRTES